MDDTLQQALRRGTEAGGRYALVMPREAGTHSSGMRTGMRAGRSLDFRDYRDYHPGDDLRWVDWNVFARTDKLTVKLFQEEVCPHADIVIDNSRSMALAGTRKLEAAAGLAAMLAIAAANARFTLSVWSCREALVKLPGDPSQPATWQTLAFDSRLTLAEALRLQPPALKRRGLRFLVSDLLWPGEPTDVLQRLGDNAAAMHIIHLLATDDVTPPEHGFVRVVDAETAEELDIFYDDAARQRYADAFGRHVQDWSDACRKAHVTLTRFVAEEFVRTWTLDPLLAAHAETNAGIVEGV